MLVWLVSPSSLRAALRQRGSIALLAAILAAGLFVYIGTFLPIAGQNLEPFSWTGGISIWPTEIFLIGVLLLFIFGAAMWVRRSAEEVRKASLERLERHYETVEQVRLDLRSKTADQETRRKLELDYSKNVADRLKALKEGAFNPWHQQPAVKILLWVLASISALGLEWVLV